MLRLKKILFLAALIPLISFCSDDDKSSNSPGLGASQLPPTLDKGIFGTCLNLQKLSEYVNNAGFSYPGIKYLRDYKVLDGAAGLDKNLMARSVEFRQTVFNHLNEFEGTIQSDCETVQIPVTGQITATYKIKEYTPTSLSLELVPFTSSPLPARPKGSKFLDSYKSFPQVKRYEIEVPTPTELSITASHRLAPFSCDNGRKIDVRETTVYVWGATAPALPATARMTPAFVQSLRDHFPSFDWELTPVPAPREDLVEVKSSVLERFMVSSHEMESTCVF